MHKFIKDPIYGEIDIPKEYAFIADLLETKEFKRLSKIMQLGECFNIFNSAIHSRYSHSLGVYFNAKRIINNLSINISPKDRKIILAAALLHDLGHGPRSHCFEQWTKHSHEKMTNRIILDMSTEVNKVLLKHKINPKEVVSIINHKHKNKYFYQIVSSQIVAVRLDYLWRDSYFVGTTYGKIDSGILTKWVDVKNNQLVFDLKAIDLIISILFARAQMFKQIYINKKVLVYEYLLGEMFNRFKQIAKNKSYRLNDKYNLYYLLEPFINDKEWDLKTFQELDDQKLNLIIESWSYEKDEILSFLTNSYLHKNKFICTSNLKLVDTKNKSYKFKAYEYDFVFYNPKEKIMINTGDGLIEINKLSDENLFMIDEYKIKYKFYFGIKK